MFALALAFGLLISHLATATAVVVPAGLRSSVPVEERDATIAALEPLESLESELYYLRQLQDLRNRMNSRRVSKRFFCNPYGCI